MLVRGSLSAPDGGDATAAARVVMETTLARLDSGAAMLVRSVAVLGERNDLRLLAAAAGLTLGEAESAAARLEDSGVLERDGERWRFPSAADGEAVSQLTSEAFRQAAHARVAAALADVGAPVAARAPHVARSAAPGDAAAVALLSRVAADRARRAPAAAVELYRAALVLASDASEQRRTLLLPLARALAATGRFEECHAVALEALESVPPAPAVERAHVAALAAQVDTLRGDADAAAALIEEGYALAGTDARARASLLGGRGPRARRPGSRRAAPRPARPWRSGWS